MPHHRVVIETRDERSGSIVGARAGVAEGPKWCREFTDWSYEDQKDAFRLLCLRIRSRFSKHTFDFKHAQTDPCTATSANGS